MLNVGLELLTLALPPTRTVRDAAEEANGDALAVATAAVVFRVVSVAINTEGVCGTLTVEAENVEDSGTPEFACPPGHPAVDAEPFVCANSITAAAAAALVISPRAHPPSGPPHSLPWGTGTPPRNEGGGVVNTEAAATESGRGGGGGIPVAVAEAGEENVMEGEPTQPEPPLIMEAAARMAPIAAFEDADM